MTTYVGPLLERCGKGLKSKEFIKDRENNPILWRLYPIRPIHGKLVERFVEEDIRGNGQTRMLKTFHHAKQTFCYNGLIFTYAFEYFAQSLSLCTNFGLMSWNVYLCTCISSHVYLYISVKPSKFFLKFKTGSRRFFFLYSYVFRHMFCTGLNFRELHLNSILQILYLDKFEEKVNKLSASL